MGGAGTDGGDVVYNSDGGGLYTFTIVVHWFTATVAPSSDHYCINVVLPSGDHCY